MRSRPPPDDAARPRRRRAAGRPAGAPSETSVAVDIVLPAQPEPDSRSVARDRAPAQDEPAAAETDADATTAEGRSSQVHAGARKPATPVR